MQNQITSLQNDKIKFLFQLKEKSRVRKKEKCFILEGKRELTLAIHAGYVIQQIFYCPPIISKEEILGLINHFEHHILLFEVTPEVYQKIAYRSTTEGLVSMVQSKNLDIKNMELTSKKPLILVTEAPEKPGNIGALLRTADAANLDAVLIANPKTDVYNPNIIRSSVGCLFTTKIATGSTEEIISFLKDHKINLYGAALEASVNYNAPDYTKSTAIIVGTEATGLSPVFLSNTDQNIKIPMSGVIDSMNVSVAAGILIFEAKRQRDFL